MDISWYGHSCFRLVERGLITIVTDPFSDEIGLPGLKLKSDVVTVSHDVPGHNYLDAVKSYQHIIHRPGEYEIGDVFITGVALDYVKDAEVRHNVGYLFEYGSLNILHLGDLNHVPDQSVIERLQVNILLVPVGGGNGLRAAEAAEVVAMFEPNLVVPMHYALPGLRFELDGVEKFLKAMGVSKPHEADTLRVTASDLPEQTQVVVLAPLALSRNTETTG